MKSILEYRQKTKKEKYMKNGIGIWVLAAALVAPQAILWAVEAPAGGSAAPSTTVSTPKPKKPMKGRHHHKKAQKSPYSGASTTNPPATK